MTGDKVEKDSMTYSKLSDLEMAGMVRMLMRDDLNHEFVCVGARDRIMYLSQQSERLRKILEAVRMDSVTWHNYLATDVKILIADALAESV